MISLRKALGACALACVAAPGVAQAEEVPPQGLERLAFMEGRWHLHTQAIVEGEWREVRRETLDVRRVLDGKFLRFSFTSAFDEREFTAEVTLSFDVARGIYRMAFNTTLAGYLDLYEGDFADGVLRLSNEATGTGFPRDEGLQVGRFAFRRTSADAFDIEASYSDDGGKMWQNYQRLFFERVAG